MTREEMIGKVCLSSEIQNDECIDCAYCMEVLNNYFDKYDKQIRAEVIDEFHKTKIEVLNWLIKRQSEGYGTTNGELLDYIYDYKLKEQNE